MAVVPALLVGAFITRHASQTALDVLQHKATEQLISLRELKKSQIIAYLDTIEAQVLNLSQDLTVVDASRDFIDAFDDVITTQKLAVSRSEVEHYYSQWFTPEYVKRNPGSEVDVGQMLTSLDELALNYQYRYIAANANDLGKKDRLVRAGDSDYDLLHGRYHPFFP